jgi:hypothetical protein
MPLDGVKESSPMCIDFGNEKKGRRRHNEKGQPRTKVKEGKQIHMIIMETLLQGTLMGGSSIKRVMETKIIKKESISMNCFLKDLIFPSLM